MGPDPHVKTEAMRFSVDAMLVKLARYLRVIGHDAVWDFESSLATSIERADHENRVFLTRNHNVGHQYPLPRRWLLIRADDPVEQLRHVIREYGIDPEERLFSRCICCNVELVEIVKSPELAARVAERVFHSYRRFFTCPRCDTVFWKGTHVRNTCRKLGLPDVSECIPQSAGF